MLSSALLGSRESPHPRRQREEGRRVTLPTGKAPLPLPPNHIPSAPALLGPTLLRGTPPCVTHPAGIPLLGRGSPADANPPTPIPGAGFRSAPAALPGRIRQPRLPPGMGPGSVLEQLEVQIPWRSAMGGAGQEWECGEILEMFPLPSCQHCQQGWDGEGKDGKE